jgi:hypothetical protein
VPRVELPFWTPFTYHVTAVSWGPVTVAVNVVALPPDTVAVVGDTVTVVCWLPPPPPPPPLLGAWAMHPARGNTMDATNKQETAGNKDFRTGASDEPKVIANV